MRRRRGGALGLVVVPGFVLGAVAALQLISSALAGPMPPGAYSTCTILAIEGTPAPFRMKSM